MLRKIINFLKTPTGKRLVAWATPIVISWIMQRLNSSKSDKTSGKRSKK